MINTLFIKHKDFLTLVYLCLVSLLLSWLYTPNYDQEHPDIVTLQENPVKSSLSILLVPIRVIESFFSTVIEAIYDSWNFIVLLFRRPAEAEEFESLAKTVESLSIQLEEERNNYRRLERLWRFSNSLTSTRPSFRFVPAKVISVEPTDWYQYLTIDKGSNNGINVDMPVITQPNLPSRINLDKTKVTFGTVVGRIQSVQTNSAKVQLITDRFSVVAVSVGPLRDLMLLKGDPKSGKCVISDIPATSRDFITEGSLVLIDERSSVFPPGMIVGWISAIKQEPSSCYAEVQPSFVFSRLRECLVLTNY